MGNGSLARTITPAEYRAASADFSHLSGQIAALRLTPREVECPSGGPRCFFVTLEARARLSATTGEPVARSSPAGSFRRRTRRTRATASSPRAVLCPKPLPSRLRSPVDQGEDRHVPSFRRCRRSDEREPLESTATSLTR